MNRSAVAGALAVGCALAVAHVAAGAAASDPLAPQQWYLEQARMFPDPNALPRLAPVRVAVIDSGADLGHPELAGRIVAARSFVGGGARDTNGHGTVVAGMIAAAAGNGIGIAGLAPSARLLIAKIVGPDGGIGVGAEARALRWAVDQGARVVNMSFGGTRDPRHPSRDTFSREEQRAVAYAVRRGVLVVAAVGNADQEPREPWPYASWPAALPHVLGVSAVNRAGRAPSFSNRDRLFNDIAAPGVAIVSTVARSLTATRPECAEQGYTLCAPGDLGSPEGTSFAAALVTAAAANLFALRPSLRAEQVAAIIQRAATDLTPVTGCAACTQGRDALTGWGLLNARAARAALGRALPPPDRYEPNDEAGKDAYRLWFAPKRTVRTVRATVDFWDDHDDVYAVHLHQGQRLVASLRAAATGTALAVWAPAARSVNDFSGQRLRLGVSATPGHDERLFWTAAVTGWHHVQVRIAEAAGPVRYRLTVTRR